jgi:2-polyprenyl-3-methyl-5-hydroxy-6-metoxy-1,4-benzoquinol methylase
MFDRWRAQDEGEANAGVQTCPACAASTAEWVERTNRLRFAGGLTLEALRCRRCAHRWLLTTPEVQGLIEAQYDGHYAGFRVDPYFNAVVSEELEQRLAAIVPPPATLLDVGCGNGEFLSLAKAARYTACGIDVSEAAAEGCRQRGLEVNAGDFLSRTFDQQFDIITLWDVMEHLRSPGDFARRAASLLAPDGVLLLKIPSKGSLNFSLLRLVSGRGGLLLGAPGHIQFFSESSLRRLLARTGFRQVLWFTSKRFRSQQRTLRPKKLIGRAVVRLISRLAGDQNLYVVATRSSFPEGVTRRIQYRRLDRLGESD